MGEGWLHRRVDNIHPRCQNRILKRHGAILVLLHGIDKFLENIFVELIISCDLGILLSNPRINRE